jgi:hypothetical protein
VDYFWRRYIISACGRRSLGYSTGASLKWMECDVSTMVILSDASHRATIKGRLHTEYWSVPRMTLVRRLQQ